jgi:hypothetical protein
MVQTIGALAANAADPARRRRTYSLLRSTCSSGYDSTTVTALAAAAVGPAGVVALSLRSARGGADDSGRPIADALRVACIERDREHAAREGREVEWLTTGSGGGDFPLTVFEPELQGSVLLTGVHGDRVWERTTQPSGVLRRIDTSGASLADFRRRVGCLHVPIPFIGALRDVEIHAISNSPALRPYSVGGSYDRPICRRILEQAGVPRRLVGYRKQAAAIHFSRNARYLSTETRASLDATLRARGMLHEVRRDLHAFRAVRVVFRVTRKAIKMAPMLEWPLGWLRDRLDRPYRARENSLYANLLFCWALEQSLRAAPPAARQSTTKTGASIAA